MSASGTATDAQALKSSEERRLKTAREIEIKTCQFFHGEESSPHFRDAAPHKAPPLPTKHNAWQRAGHHLCRQDDFAPPQSNLHAKPPGKLPGQAGVH